VHATCNQLPRCKRGGKHSHWAESSGAFAATAAASLLLPSPLPHHRPDTAAPVVLHELQIEAIGVLPKLLPLQLGAKDASAARQDLILPAWPAGFAGQYSRSKTR